MVTHILILSPDDCATTKQLYKHEIAVYLSVSCIAALPYMYVLEQPFRKFEIHRSCQCL